MGRDPPPKSPHVADLFFPISGRPSHLIHSLRCASHPLSAPLDASGLFGVGFQQGLRRMCRANLVEGLGGTNPTVDGRVDSGGPWNSRWEAGATRFSGADELYWGTGTGNWRVFLGCRQS